jgi:flagellar hook assembly protein FlgD
VVYDVAAGSGTDFALEPGHAYALVITGDTTLDLVGASTATSRELSHAAGRFNHHWLGLPVPSAAADADALAQSMDEVTKAARYDTANDTYQSWFELNSAWMGENFPMEPGIGVVVSVSAAAQFAPATGWPSATAEAVPDTGYESITVQLDGTASDVNGSIARYQWDFEGDGVFDYDSAAGPAVQHTYYLPDQGPGTYRPTLLVTDDQGHRAMAFASLTVDTLGVNFSLAGFAPGNGETVTIRYTLPEPGTVTLHIYGEDGALVKTLLDGVAQTAGAQQVFWDGANDAGEMASDGTYYVVIELESGGYTSIFDTRSVSGGVDITGGIADISITGVLAPLEGQYVDIDYSLPENALVSIQIRDLAGTLICQLLDGAARAAGAQTEVWDGTDDSGAVVAPGSAFTVQITAVSLPSNSLITRGGTPQISNIAAAPLRFSPASNPYGPQDDRALVIGFELNKPADVSARVYADNGILVRTWTDTGLAAGANQLSWSGRNDSGVLMANGTYRVRLQAEDAYGALSEPFVVQTEIYY